MAGEIPILDDIVSLSTAALSLIFLIK
jgi:hypothetical protein